MIKSIIRNLIPDYLFIQYKFWQHTGHFPQLNPPVKYCEKIQWLKLYNHNPLYTKLVDKAEVKKYVKDLIGDDYVIPTLKVWNKISEIDWDSLPESFVVKTTHGGGGSSVLICKNKNNFDKEYAIKVLNASMHEDIYSVMREWPYKNVPHRIIAEKYMEDYSGALIDYKVMCFNGVPKLIQVHLGRTNGFHTQDFYDIQWNKLDLTQKGCITSDIITPRPSCLSKMLEFSQQLSSNIPHVRIDWYVVGDRLYFGEFTFFDASGFDEFLPDRYENEIGSWINIEGIKK